MRKWWDAIGEDGREAILVVVGVLVVAGLFAWYIMTTLPNLFTNHTQIM